MDTRTWVHEGRRRRAQGTRRGAVHDGQARERAEEAMQRLASVPACGCLRGDVPEWRWRPRTGTWTARTRRSRRSWARRRPSRAAVDPGRGDRRKVQAKAKGRLRLRLGLELGFLVVLLLILAQEEQEEQEEPEKEGAREREEGCQEGQPKAIRGSSRRPTSTTRRASLAPASFRSATWSPYKSGRRRSCSRSTPRTTTPPRCRTKKFYNLEKWSREEAARRSGGPRAAAATAAIERESFNDEEERKRGDSGGAGTKGRGVQAENAARGGR